MCVFFFFFKQKTAYEIGVRLVGSEMCIRDRIKETLRDFGMEEFLKRRIGELSGGQQQRVMIARAMIGDPKLLILDEPTTGVDARSTKILYDMLYEINTKYNTTIFMITHGRLQECKGCDRILRMDEGRIVEE